MTEAEFGARLRLEQLQDTLARQVGSYGRGLRDLAHIPVSREVLADVELCIRSQDRVVIGTGLYVLQGLLIDRSVGELPREFRQLLVDRVEELLDHPADSVAQTAMDWFAQLRAAYPRYRQKMLGYLASDSSWRRKLALRYYETYARPGEIRPLLRFNADDAASEIHPDGEWCFVLRNRALERIEEQLGLRFDRILRTEPYRGTSVRWYDWAPLRDWWLANCRRAQPGGGPQAEPLHATHQQAPRLRVAIDDPGHRLREQVRPFHAIAFHGDEERAAIEPACHFRERGNPAAVTCQVTVHPFLT